MRKPKKGVGCNFFSTCYLTSVFSAATKTLSNDWLSIAPLNKCIRLHTTHRKFLFKYLLEKCFKYWSTKAIRSPKIWSNPPSILCKLDIQKAYDHLNWNFLLETLSKNGFGGRWIRWIKFCISTVKLSILINGTPIGFFSSRRGLRQGDPLSPFLFIIAMESLNEMLKIAQGNSWLKGFRASNREDSVLEITHLQYAKNTLIFCEANRNQLMIIRVIFVLLEAISGLHINWNKSFLYPVNEVPNLGPLAGTLGGRIGELPTVYLGMPLGAKNRSVEWRSHFTILPETLPQL